MTERLARLISFFAPAAVMSAWATVMLHCIATGRIKDLLSPMFRDYVLAASVLLFLLSVIYLFLYEPAQASPASFGVRSWFRQLGRWTVLLVPVVAASVLSPAALSSTTMANRIPTGPTASTLPMPTSNSEATAKALLDSDPNQPIPLEVTDLITLSRSPDQMKAFDGRRVRVVGMMAHPPGSDPTLLRWIMWCCAADAQPASVQLSGNTEGTWKDTQWLEVIGKATFPSTLGHVIPRIEVETIKTTDEPDEPYLSP